MALFLRPAGLASLGAVMVFWAFSLSPAAAQSASSPKLLSLSQAVDRAVAASPKLEAALSGIAAAEGSERQAGLYPNPNASVQFENVGVSAFMRTYAGPTQTTAGVSQLIELGGKRDARISAALANRQGAEIDAVAARLDLVRDVTIAYADALAAQDNAGIARDTELAAQQVLEDVIRRVNAARDPLFQRSKAEVAYSASGIARKNAEEARRGALQRLGKYWGAATVEETLEDPLPTQRDGPLAMGIYEERLRNAPDLDRYRRLREAREAELRLAEANAVPDITASGGVRGFAGTSAVAFVVGVSVPIPILNQNQGAIARAQAELRKVDQERRQAELERSQALVTAWTNWRTSWLESNTLKDETLPKAENAFRSALAGYRSGAFEYLEVLDAQRTFFEQRATYVRAIAKLHDSRAETERLAPLAEPITQDMGNQNTGSNQ